MLRVGGIGLVIEAWSI